MLPYSIHFLALFCREKVGRQAAQSGISRDRPPSTEHFLFPTHHKRKVALTGAPCSAWALETPPMRCAACCCLFLLALRGFCDQDIDLRFGAVGGGKNAGDGSLSNWAPAFQLQYRCAVPLSQSFSILGGEEFQSYSRISSTLPLLEINYPVNSITSAGVAYNGFGTIQLSGFSHVLSQSEPIAFPVAKQENNSPLAVGSMTERFKNGADFFFDVPLWRFKLTGDAFYNNLIFDYSRDTILSGDTIRLTRPNSHDADLWYNASVAVDVLDKKLWVKAAGLFKDDLNPYDGYNITGYFVGLEGESNVLWNTLAVSGDAFARYIESDIMDLKDYGDRFGTTEHLRLVGKIPSGFFVKGDCAFESALTMRKLRAELSLRKSWLNQYSVEVGAWTTAGGLFPRQCAYISSTLAVTPRDKLVPSFRVFTHWNGYFANGDSSLDLYRTDIGLSFRHDFPLSPTSVLKHLSFNCGALYRKFTEMPYEISPQNMDLFVGFSNWL